MTDCGAPTEFFHPATVNRLKLYDNLDRLDDYLASCIAQTKSADDVFGIKFHFYQLQDFVTLVRKQNRFARSSIQTILQHYFPDATYIWLRRRDVIRQSISALIAMQTQMWEVSARQNNTAKPVQPPRPSFWNMVRINDWRQYLTRQDHAWGRFFHRNNVEPVEIIFEDFITDRGNHLKSLRLILGLPERQSPLWDEKAPTQPVYQAEREALYDRFMATPRWQVTPFTALEIIRRKIWRFLARFDLLRKLRRIVNK